MYRLLIADSDYHTRRELASGCPWEALGFEIVGQAGDGLSAYAFIKSRPVDVLLGSVRLPVLSGPELVMELREQNLPVAAVLLGEPPDDGLPAQAEDSGGYRLIRSSAPAEIARVFSSVKAELDAGRRPSAQAANPAPGRQDGIIDLIQAYLRHNFAAATLRSAARLVYMEPAYLSRFYRRHTGGSFSGYMTAVKMRFAAGLLRNSDRKIREISAMAGYAGPRNFSRVFKKHCGLSPRAYRLKCRGEK